MISLQQLELAINRARAVSPSRGADAQLDPEVSLLAELYGQMIYYRLTTLALSALSKRELEAWQRWSLALSQQTQTHLTLGVKREVSLELTPCFG